MEDLPPEPQNLRFLRLLVTVLTATMILGIASIVVLLFLRVAKAPDTGAPALPAEISLPDGITAQAVTYGAGWYAVVTNTNQILIFDHSTGALRQTVEITN